MKINLPAEWAQQSAVMLTWPNADGDFARSFDEVERNFIDIAKAISRFEAVWINYGEKPAILRKRLKDEGIPADRLKVHPVASNDVWARDHGPITVRRNGQILHLDFTFNGWGDKYDATLDNQVTQQLSQLGAFTHPVEYVDFVLEGGAIDTDGVGTLLTTEQCLLSPTRNPAYEKWQIEDQLKQCFGVERVLWLERGGLAGDDTDSHVDTLARFCDANTIAYQACDDKSDAHYTELAEMAKELRKLRMTNGEPYDLVPLPLPAAIVGKTGRRLPASYANFLIINDAVLVPTYNDDADTLALKRLEGCFPDREVIGIDCRPLIEQYGSLHCVTMQIPMQ